MVWFDVFKVIFRGKIRLFGYWKQKKCFHNQIWNGPPVVQITDLKSLCFFFIAFWRKRLRNEDSSSSHMDRKRLRYYYRLESESSRASEDDTESVYSLQGKETGRALHTCKYVAASCKSIIFRHCKGFIGYRHQFGS